MSGERVHPVRVIREIVATETGHWCNPCAAPSGVRIWAIFRLDDRMHLQDGLGCIDCHSRDVTLSDNPTPR